PKPTRAGAASGGAARRGGRALGRIEEYFLETLAPGDSFAFAGEVLRLNAIVEDEALVSRTTSDAPKAPSYAGGKFPLSTWLAKRVRALIADPAHWTALPPQTAEWLDMQRRVSSLPRPDGLLVETFPRGARHYLAAYPFEGRLAHQSLGMLLTRRLERLGARPLGFVCNDYSITVWGLDDMGRLDLAGLFGQDMLGDDLEEWLAESALLKRTFRACAQIALLVERRHTGREKTGRQMTVSTDLIYDVLRAHDPGHVLLEAAREDALGGLLDLERLADLLARAKGRIEHRRLDRVSPLAVPGLLEIGKESVQGEARDAILAEAARELVREAGG
ncbi:MAG: DNA ligase-associated DEXH box helicase, partial [Hyphomicrobiales bacterium]|nr:DNA ligase-associated DEXH box helicase [Hyphomicrobiales bacterium]